MLNKLIFIYRQITNNISAECNYRLPYHLQCHGELYSTWMDIGWYSTKQLALNAFELRIQTSKPSTPAFYRIIYIRPKHKFFNPNILNQEKIPIREYKDESI